MLMHWNANFTEITLLQWAPTYLNQALNVPLAQLGKYLLAPALIEQLANIGAASVESLLLARGTSILGLRRAACVIASLTQSLGMLLFAIPGARQSCNVSGTQRRLPAQLGLQRQLPRGWWQGHSRAFSGRKLSSLGAWVHHPATFTCFAADSRWELAWCLHCPRGAASAVRHRVRQVCSARAGTRCTRTLASWQPFSKKLVQDLSFELVLQPWQMKHRIILCLHFKRGKGAPFHA